MEEKQLTTIGTFCLNKACEDYKKVNHGNMIKYGKTDSGVQRSRCKTCKKAFVHTKGTMFYRIRHSEEEVVECMEMVANRSSLAAIHRIKGIKEETVDNWLELAASHVEQFAENVVTKYQLSRVQLDALWTFVGHKGEKGGDEKKSKEVSFGAESPLTWRPDFE